MYFDFFCLSIALLQLGLFGLGLTTVFQTWLGEFRLRFGSGSDALDLLFVTFAGLLTICSISLLIESLGFPTLTFFSILVFGVQVFGIWGAPRYFRFKINGHKEIAAHSFLFLITSGFWIWVMRDHLALNSQNDGTVHLVFLDTVLRSGFGLLINSERGFASQFGREVLPFYPTGSHFLLAIFSYFPWCANLLSVAQILKTGQFLVLSTLPSIAWIVLRAIFSDRKIHSLWLLAFCLAIASWRSFPVVPVDHGGFSRLFAYFICVPIVSWLLVSAANFPDKIARAPLVCSLGLLGSFFLHAGTMGAFTLSIGGIMLWQIWAKRKNLREVFKSLPFFLGLAFACILLVWFLRVSAATESIDSDNSARLAAAWSFRDYWRSRAISFFNILVRQDFEPRIFSLRYFLCLIGAGGVLLSMRGFVFIKPVIRFYVLYSLALALFLLGTFYVPFQPIYRLGLINLHHVYRHTEMVYLAHLITCFIGIIVVELILKFCTFAFVRKLALAALSVYALVDITLGFKGAHWRIEHFALEYLPPKHSEYDEASAYVWKNLNRDAVLVGLPRFQEALAYASNVQHALNYGECQLFESANCKAREKLARSLYDELVFLLASSERPIDCWQRLKAFGDNAYFMTETIPLDQAIAANTISKDLRLCGDLAVVYHDARFVLWGPKKL